MFVNMEQAGLGQAALEQRRFMTRVYAWMAFALSVTATVALGVAMSPGLTAAIFGNSVIFFGLIIGELVLVGSLSAMVSRMSVAAATAAFIGYSLLNGLTLSIIFYAYTAGSIAGAFFITAGTFGVMSVYGYMTDADLSGYGSIFFMGIVGIILATIANMFLHSSALEWITTYIGLAIFVGLTAYDTQRIKNMNIVGNEGTAEESKAAIMGALALYLDFINLFLYMLRIFGRRRD